jgi:coenzyme F420-0:L-glutamate ligase/coenzyme F420-1:gamma-L-glutamate ligase
VPGLPLIQPGDDLAGLLCRQCAASGIALRDGDVVVVAQKVVSKAENRFVELTTVKPSAEAVTIAQTVLKDPRLVEVVLSQSRRVVRCAPHALIVEHKLGLVMANAGVDQSNVGSPPCSERVLLLSEDPDASAARLRAAIHACVGADVAVVINDSFGRAWRLGTVGVAIGAAGLPSLDDRRGKPDLFGRSLKVTVIGFADEIAAAASLVMGQGDEGRPVVVLRGLVWSGTPTPASAVCRPVTEDLFR